ncbi:BatD family protein [Dyella sp. C9]|uniref:BatD family protein n=1 Tax=Dyella sp. C9 TaxID=2202154 RepID=UPI0013006FB6|nr:BatD family protein [Dyella sp. C9]
MKAWMMAAMLLLAGGAHAQQPAPATTAAAPAPVPLVVRVHQVPPGQVLQGGTTVIKVDMLTPDFFTEAPALPELHVDGAYLSLSDETPGHLVETIDGATWSGVSRTYLFTPLVSGKVEIPSFDITAHVGAQRTAVTAQTTPLTVDVAPLVLPPGVNEALIASSLKLTQTVTPQDSGLHVGDSVTRRIEISAEGAPSMMLPPVEFKPVSGLQLYPSPPIARDVVGNQGGFVGGSRVDEASYVIQRRGHYSLPPVTVRWMDSRTHAWRESRVPGVSFHAWWGAPAKPRFALPQQGFMPRLIGWFTSDEGIAVLVLAVLAWAAWWCRDRLARAWAWWKGWRERRRHSEPKVFAALKSQRNTGSASELAVAVDDWVRRAAQDGAPATMAAWCTRYGDDALRAAWTSWQNAMYGASSSDWSASSLVQGIEAARKRWKLSRRRQHHQAALPPLNPV